MCEKTDRKEFGGEAIHVGDCYVWAEIYYLDSPTDYREYISSQVSQRSTEIGTEFVTLDKPWFSFSDRMRGVARSLCCSLIFL